MALKDRIATPKPAPVHGAPCSVGQTYRANLHDGAELAALHGLLYLEGNDAGQVWRELTASGYRVARDTINKHRGRRCRCFTIDKDFCPDCRDHTTRCECA